MHGELTNVIMLPLLSIVAKTEIKDPTQQHLCFIFQQNITKADTL